MGERRASSRRGPPHALLRRLGGEQEGIGLIEVIVSALLLVLVASGIYLGLDAASATSGVNKRRSVAAGIAQQDQDRMRAMAVSELSNHRQTRTVRVGGLSFEVSSTASWVTDGAGAASCTSATVRTSYLRIASSVTWPGMAIEPVTVESIVAPPNGSFGTDLGSLAVEVRDRDGRPVPGVAATLSGPQSYTDLTNELGCVLWGYLPAGAYKVAIAKPGYVDPQSVATPVRDVGVAGESTATVGFDYDRGGRIAATYTTWSGSAWVPAAGTAFTAQHPRLTVPLPPIGDGQPHDAFTSALVYPFPDAYSVWAGTCAGAAPVANGQAATTVAVPPGGVGAVALRMASADVLVRDGGAPVAGATVRLTGTGSGCGTVPVVATTGADGFPTARAVPLGTYALCVRTAAGKVRTLASLDERDPRDRTVTTVDMAGATTGSCP